MPRTKRKLKQDDDESSHDETTKKATSRTQRFVKNRKEARDNKKTRSRSPSPNEEQITNDEKKWNLKICSWNINGLRAWMKKPETLKYLLSEDPDIICLQETKCTESKVPKDVKDLDGYQRYWLDEGEKAGYAGVAVYSRLKPIEVTYGIGNSKYDDESRVMTLEFDKFFLVNAYVPNSGQGLRRLDYRMEWNEEFRNYLKNLETKKPIILTGDLNCAHKEIDLENPKTNLRSAGFTIEERTDFTKLLNDGLIDSFRLLYPNKKKAYTFWSTRTKARERNVGWRLDYFILSEKLKNNLCDCLIKSEVMGSDHCPIVLLINV